MRLWPKPNTLLYYENENIVHAAINSPSLEHFLILYTPIEKTQTQ